MWPFKSAKEKRQKQEDLGYQYAATELLKGKAAIDIYSQVVCSRHFDDYSIFDSGIECALEDWKKKTKEEYDYDHVY